MTATAENDLPPAAATAADASLEDCPRCGYALRGLPTLHNCPECALAFDRRWQIFRTDQVPRRFLRMGILTLLTLYGSVVLWMGVGSALGFGLFGRAVLALSFVGGMVFLYWLATRRREAFVAIGPRGVFVHTTRRRCRLHAWDDMERALFNLSNGRIEFRECNRPAAIPRHIFRNQVETIDRCVMAINRELRARGRGIDWNA